MLPMEKLLLGRISLPQAKSCPTRTEQGTTTKHQIKAFSHPSLTLPKTPDPPSSEIGHLQQSCALGLSLSSIPLFPGAMSILPLCAGCSLSPVPLVTCRVAGQGWDALQALGRLLPHSPPGSSIYVAPVKPWLGKGEALGRASKMLISVVLSLSSG